MVKHITAVRVGDTIVCHDGVARTVCAKDIKHGFMGTTIFGDSWELGTKLVECV